MITSHTKMTKDVHDIQLSKAVKLRAVGKKYSLMKTPNRDIDTNFNDFWAVKDVSLDINQGEVLGIIGRNGAGKTTLLNIIAGTLFPTHGERIVNGKTLGLFNLGVGFQDELTGKENIFLNGAIIGATKKELSDKLSSIIGFSELGNFINMPLGTYSQGMRLRLGFSIIANLDFDILVIDEVLAVGDTLFQNKCFERLMDFRRLGKTLLITTQSMDLIERLCDKVALLDHGCLISCGDTVEGINKYHALLNTEKFFVGPAQKNTNLVENTKKWTDDKASWGRRLGTKQIVIESVELLNKFGWRCKQIRSGSPLKIKVCFTARDNVKEPHFGVAIFRNDGVYCYGPNTKFDGYDIAQLQAGKGYFVLDCNRLLLAPGEYRLSVAIWDKNETLAFDYHNAYYKLRVTGYNNANNELLNMPFKVDPGVQANKFEFLGRRDKHLPDLVLLRDRWGKKIETEGLNIESVKLLNSLGEQKDVFITNESVKFAVNFNTLKIRNKNFYVWLGIYRDDGIYCQGLHGKISYKNRKIILMLPQLRLLPGNYKISIGFYGQKRKEFIVCHHGICRLKAIFSKSDHGTVFLDHKWKIKLS